MSSGVTRCKGTVRPAVISDIPMLLPLREADRVEIEVTGRVAAAALVESFSASKPHVFTILVDGVPAGVFGAAAGPNGAGIPWMLGTDDLLKIPRDLVVQGRQWIQYLNQIYPHLENYVHEFNYTSIRWLKAMGFEFPGEFVLLPNGHVFRRFTRDV